MNKKNAHLFLPLVQALVDGKTIQYNPCDTGWADIAELNFYESPEHYRIKPEPREWWARVTTEGNQSYLPGEIVGGDLSKWRGRPDASDKWEYVRVREILD